MNQIKLLKFKIVEPRYAVNVGKYFVYCEDPVVYKIVRVENEQVYYTWVSPNTNELDLDYIDFPMSIKDFLGNVKLDLYKFVDESTAPEKLRNFKYTKNVTV